MLNLVYKELKLSINSFFFIMPLILALLFFIPNWIFTIVFMYFFWITVTNVYSGYLAHEDYSFVAMLPVSKDEIVTSKAMSLFIIEGLHLVFGIIFAVVHNQIYGTWNFFLDANYAFVGLIFVMYGIFNISFLPYYFKTAYYFGKPVILGCITTLLYAFSIEYGNLKFEALNKLFEGNISTQLVILVVGIIMSVALSFVAVKLSIKNYKQIS